MDIFCPKLNTDKLVFMYILVCSNIAALPKYMNIVFSLLPLLLLDFIDGMNKKKQEESTTRWNLTIIFVVAGLPFSGQH